MCILQCDILNDSTYPFLRLQQGGFLRRTQQFHLLWPQPYGVRRSRSNLWGGWWWIKDEGWSGIREIILRLFVVNPWNIDGWSSGIIIQQKDWHLDYFVVCLFYVCFVVKCFFVLMVQSLLQVILTCELNGYLNSFSQGIWSTRDRHCIYMHIYI